MTGGLLSLSPKGRGRKRALKLLLLPLLFSLCSGQCPDHPKALVRVIGVHADGVAPRRSGHRRRVVVCASARIPEGCIVADVRPPDRIGSRALERPGGVRGIMEAFLRNRAVVAPLPHVAQNVEESESVRQESGYALGTPSRVQPSPGVT